MKPLVVASIIAMCGVSTSAMAQTTTAIGTGTGTANSNSASKAVAISGQGGTGVGAVKTTTVVNAGTTIPATQTIKNVPTEFAPGLAAAGLETCLGSVSGGGAFVGTGFSFGTTIPDPGCAARLDARTLWSFGLKKAAVARLCLNTDIYRAMPEVCWRYLPQAQPQPVVLSTASAEKSNNLMDNFRATFNQELKGGQIWLVEGTTGKDRLCNDYDGPKQRCRVWAH